MKEENKQRLQQRDLERINALADYLNAEAEDELRYQAERDFAELDEAVLSQPTVVRISEAGLER